MGKRVTKISQSKSKKSFEDALNEFLLSKRAEGRSETTLSDYERHVYYFFNRYPTSWIDNTLTTCVLQYMRKMYETIHYAYKKVADSVEKGSAMRVRIVINAGLTVCPYCNRDYINCRAENVSGAQLDHFLSKSDFPLFAVCLYNLVPVCGNCNRVKSAQKLTFASPFDNSIDWEKDISFSYSGSSLKDLKITINSRGNLDNNINAMRIEEAYQIHGSDVLEIIENAQIYNSTQIQEFKKVLSPAKLTDLEIKRLFLVLRFRKTT